MKIIIAAAALALAAGPALAAGRGAGRIGKQDATKAALAAVPGARVESAEREKEKGRDIWSFDLATKEGTREVWVDAKTGKMILPPGCEEAYEKFLKLQPDGGLANEVKGILAQASHQ